jgi:hypothetical protein
MPGVKQANLVAHAVQPGPAWCMDRPVARRTGQAYGCDRADTARPPPPVHRGEQPQGLAKKPPATTSAKVEAAIGRWKQVIGDRLRSRVDERRVTEVSVVVHVLNRMLVLGRPNYVRVV